MADEFDRGYGEEEKAVENEQSSMPYTDEDDDRTNLMKLLGYLEEELTNARVVPMTNKRMINAKMCLDIIDDIHRNLPLAVHYSEQILQDREQVMRKAQQLAKNMEESAKVLASNIEESAKVRANNALNDAMERADHMVADAQEHADNIVKDAELRARAMIDQNSIKLEAQQEAEAILNEARAEAHDRRQQTADYCDQLLHDCEEAIQMAYTSVRRSRQNLGQNTTEDRR